ncbi:MAG TPA: hypothetical protein PLT09_03375 [Deltaproteobacteria bacterium]|nr:hypothetical protein [Deltaproteobacteria bacterium]HXK46453.1 hypothetical protein [Deltaproteobacteria bacterium]
MKPLANPASQMIVPVLLLLLSLLLSVSPVHAGIVTLNGYRFSNDVVNYPDIQDSAILSGNPYFSDYSRVVDFYAGLYGYGAFRGYDDTMSYRQVFPVDGVQCSVILEQGYIPTFSLTDGITSFTMEFCTKYSYFARDIDNNIHLLLISIIPDSSSIGAMSWSVDDLPSGGTTLIYPAEPEVGQQVFGGHVTDVSAEIGGVTSEALVIEYDNLPYDYPGALTEYLLPGSAIYAVAYNWDGGINGFSQDGQRPERQDEDKKAWEDWWDEHCFISACGR